MKRLPMLLLMICACGLATMAAAQQVEKFSINHGRLSRLPADARVDLKVVMIERDIDLSSGQSELEFLDSNSSFPVKLIFDRQTSTVTFVRSLFDIGGSANAGYIKSSMSYQSYDDLGLSSGKAKRNVRVFFTTHFLFVEVGDADKMHYGVDNALFFVGPPYSVLQHYISDPQVVKLDYNALKKHVQKDCIDTIRTHGCRNFDVTHFMPVL